MSVWGVGVRLLFPAYAALLLAAWLSRQFAFLRLPFLEGTAVFLFAVLWVMAGLVGMVISARAVTRAYAAGHLVTTGLYGRMRHPLYAAHILGIMPGLALAVASWPMMLVCLATYAYFRHLIPQEDRYLEQTFGDEYRAYKARTHALFPFRKG
ncbi:MAG: isoprenylcysteine carboxylmethyltransferase family protein [Ardenticatenaceae bacterium]|nr:isoprenylcysteine carboxylmethyltransferase family protein [Anaerolineales bacterium]MCB8921410.1 isoprenylcysteine carboxylmethyltransferase family protein [Ardenticatenaceae bacterium]MCB9005113.1 isoprenylcysteine carboxylmethyltransferase family protein [Ardenticatenaceae bacterium]